jgi:hypothetical protein
MASLTGNKIKDTYTSLLKVGDNGTIDSSAQALTDGAGNALGLTLTNGGVIVSTTNGTLIGTSDSNVVGASLLNVSGNGTAGQYLISDGDGSFSWQTLSAGDITGVTAGDGLTGGGTSGDVSLAVNVDDSTIEIDTDTVRVKDSGIVTAKIADDNVTFAKIENRYTSKVEKSDTSGAVSIDWSSGTTFEFTASLTGALELDFTNFKQGQTIGIYGLTGSQTITLDSDAVTTETFNKVGSVDYDGTGTNYLQVVCVDDSADAVFNYSVATYTSDTTP